MPAVFWYFLGLSLGSSRNRSKINYSYTIDGYKAKEYYINYQMDYRYNK